MGCDSTKEVSYLAQPHDYQNGSYNPGNCHPGYGTYSGGAGSMLPNTEDNILNLMG